MGAPAGQRVHVSGVGAPVNPAIATGQSEEAAIEGFLLTLHCHGSNITKYRKAS